MIICWQMALNALKIPCARMFSVLVIAKGGLRNITVFCKHPPKYELDRFAQRCSMKKSRFAALSVILLATLLSCQTGAGRTHRTADGLGITARGAIGRLDAAFAGPMYTGDGGSSIHLAVLAPETQGDVPDFLPLYIQGMLNNNLNRFSAINLIDRQNLNMIIAQQDLAVSGRFSDRDFIRIGNLANAQYLLLGTIQRLSGNRFSLQLSITEASTGVRRATFMQDGTLAQLEGRGTLLNEATAELLGQMGVRLTEAGMQTLLEGNISAVQAEAGLARGIIAQAGGAEVEALLNFAQAATFDPAQLEALARLNTLSATISGGTIGQRILQDFQLRDQWLEAFRETARFFDNHPPFQIVFDPSLIQIGEADFGRRTVNLGMRIALDPSEAGFAALNALLEGLQETGRRDAWGFSGWPLSNITPRDRNAVVFGGRNSFRYRVDVALVNENNQIISNGRITLSTERMRFSAGDTSVTSPASVVEVVNFRNVSVESLTPTLTIAIVAVNGVRAHELSASGYMRIETGDFETKARTVFEQGRQNLNTGNFEQAIANFTKAIRLNPNFTWAFNDRGVAHYRMGNSDRAIADYTEAIRLDPNFALAFFNRGITYRSRGRRGDAARAIADHTEVIRLNPNDAAAFFSRGPYTCSHGKLQAGNRRLYRGDTA